MTARRTALTALLLFTAAGAAAQETAPAAEESATPPATVQPENRGTTLQLGPGEELREETWAMMRTLSIAGTVRRDLFFQAAQADLSGVFRGDVWGAVTGAFDFTGTAEDDLRIFSTGLARVDGRVGGNLLLRSESIQMGTNTVVEGDTSLTAVALVQDGILEGNLNASLSGTATLKGEVRGNVVLAATEITLMPGAVIGGDLLYDSESPPVISPGASVKGALRRESLPSIPYAAIAALFFFVAYTGFGLMAAGLTPRFIQGAQGVLVRMKTASLFNGSIIALFMSFMIVLFFSSSIAMALALLLAAVLTVADAMGLTALALSIGGVLLPLKFVQRALGRAAALILGMAVVHIALLVPVAGPYLFLMTHLAGIGAVVVYSVSTQKIRRVNPPTVPVPAVTAT